MVVKGVERGKENGVGQVLEDGGRVKGKGWLDQMEGIYASEEEE